MAMFVRCARRPGLSRHLFSGLIAFCISFSQELFSHNIRFCGSFQFHSSPASQSAGWAAVLPEKEH
jgi:hypothetical protein